MGRGPGACQRAILDALAGSDKLIPLGGRTRAERASLARAAAALECAGKCVTVRLWNDRHTAPIVRPVRSVASCTSTQSPAMPSWRYPALGKG